MRPQQERSDFASLGLVRKEVFVCGESQYRLLQPVAMPEAPQSWRGKLARFCLSISLFEKKWQNEGYQGQHAAAGRETA